MKHLTNLSRTGGDADYQDYRRRMMSDHGIFIGDPAATKEHTVERLKGFDMIGVYERETGDVITEIVEPIVIDPDKIDVSLLDGRPMRVITKEELLDQYPEEPTNDHNEQDG